MTTKRIAQAKREGAHQNEQEATEKWLLERKSEVAEKIERAFGQFDRAEFFSAKESQADLERRKAVWFRQRHG